MDSLSAIGAYPQHSAFVPFSAASSGLPASEPPDSTFAGLLESAKSRAGGEAPASNPSPQPALSKKPLIDKNGKLYEQCLELETFLIKNLLNGLRNTVQKSGFIDEGLAGKMYEDMLWDEYARDFTKNAGLGFADMAYLELTGQRGKALPGRA
ncbi:MAG: rod-binding protein [Treponema sp.]|jgi:flagellar protein FlgJ|nr:rod-binding protein [Treponema sp.]